MRSLVKLIVVIAVVAFIWKEGIPWWNRQHAASSTTSSSAPDDSCVAAAESAGETWGNGVGHFANPPYDMTAWDDFHSSVERRAREAEEKCLCGSESCNAAKKAMNDLRALANDMDSSLRSGSPPPSDLVQRQEAIDNGINAARDLVKQGK